MLATLGRLLRKRSVWMWALLLLLALLQLDRWLGRATLSPSAVERIGVSYVLSHHRVRQITSYSMHPTTRWTGLEWRQDWVFETGLPYRFGQQPRELRLVIDGQTGRILSIREIRFR